MDQKALGFTTRSDESEQRQTPAAIQNRGRQSVLQKQHIVLRGQYRNGEKIGEWRTYDGKGKRIKTTRHKQR
jgi:antitoxin component YwqK of YwqJK toxin-antitoxin module